MMTKTFKLAFERFPVHAVRFSFRLLLGVAFEVVRLRENVKIRIPAKLRRAVEHAGLSPHQQGTDLVRLHRRKDFPYPARDQASLRC